MGLPSATPVPYTALTGGPQNRQIIHLKPSFPQPSSRHRHVPFGTGALLAHRTRITPSHSVDERVFGRWHRCTGPYAALGGPMRPASPLSTMMRQTWWRRLDPDIAQDSSQCRITVFGSTVELLLNASSNRAAREGAIVSGRKRGMYMSETRLVACAIIISARHKRASGALSPYAQACHLPCALSCAGICKQARERDALLGGACSHGQITCICRKKYDD